MNPINRPKRLGVQDWERHPNEGWTVWTISPKGVSSSVDLTDDQFGRFAKWFTGQVSCDPNGPHIQKILPDLTDSERELLKTGVTDQEWNEMFPPEGD